MNTRKFAPLIALAFLGLFAFQGQGQPATPIPVSQSGTITTSGGNVSLTGLSGQNACTIDVGGTAWTGTLTVQGSTNWDTLQVSQFNSTTLVSSITANGLYLVTTTSLSQIRVIGPTSTGTATVYVFCTQVGQQANISANVQATIQTPLPISTPAAGIPLQVAITSATPMPVTIQTPVPIATPAGGLSVSIAAATPLPVVTSVPCTSGTCSIAATPPLTGVSGAGTAGAANQSVVADCAFNTVLPTMTSGNVGPGQCDAQGRRLTTISGALPGGTNIIGGTFNNASSSAIAGTPANQVNLGAATTVKASPGVLFTLYCINTQAATVGFVQAFNAVSGSVTLGTTVPTWQQILQPATFAYVVIPPTIGAAFSTALSVASTTTAGGATPSASGVYCYETYI